MVTKRNFVIQRQLIPVPGATSGERLGLNTKFVGPPQELVHYVIQDAGLMATGIGSYVLNKNWIFLY